MELYAIFNKEGIVFEENNSCEAKTPLLFNKKEDAEINVSYQGEHVKKIRITVIEEE